MAPINTTTRGCTLIDKQIIALIGAQGMLAGAVKRSCPEHYHIVPLDLPDFDITDYNLVLNTLVTLKADGIINCAAYTHVDACESERDRAEQVNTRGPAFSVLSKDKIKQATGIKIPGWKDSLGKYVTTL